MSVIKTEKLEEIIAAIPLNNGRRIVAIAGAPASGKSTLAEALGARIPNSRVIPMDGFHRDNDDLERAGLLARKGAAETFDVAGFSSVIRSLRSNEDLPFPTFDRENDCVVPGGGRVTAHDETILVEGNYLLLDQPHWRDLAAEWDYSILIDIPIGVLRDRLVQRWLDHGHDAAAALARAEGNDLRNARHLMDHVIPPDMTISAS
ncbi:MAG: phosphoribulokinase [Sulfitobacter sp.]